MGSALALALASASASVSASASASASAVSVSASASASASAGRLTAVSFEEIFVAASSIDAEKGSSSRRLFLTGIY
jgi:hypothetical protein